MKHVLTVITMILMLVLLVVFPEIASLSVAKALNICVTSIVPSLFPFLIVTNLWMHSGFAQIISNILNPAVINLFRLPRNAAPALLFGCLSGFPIGAKTAVTLYSGNHLQKNEVEQLLLFCNNAGPGFVLGMIGNGLFHSRRVGAVLWLIHVISAMTIGIVFRGQNDSPTTCIKRQNSHIAFQPCIVTKSIIDAGTTIFQIALYVAAFSVIIGFLTAILPPSLTNTTCYPIIIGFFEISSGISSLKLITPKLAFIVSSVLLGWNGCCIHFQVMALTSGTSIRLHKYFCGKLLHAATSLLLSYIAAPLLF